MKTNEGITSLPPDLAADTQAVLDHLTTGKPLDREIARRIQERGNRIREEILQKHGILDIGVPAIRELRSEIPESSMSPA